MRELAIQNPEPRQPRLPRQGFRLIVDYNGMLRSLREALAQYALGDEGGGQEEIVEPIRGTHVKGATLSHRGDGETHARPLEALSRTAFLARRASLDTVRRNTTIGLDRESVRAKMRALASESCVSTAIRWGKQEMATLTVLEQAELLAKDWAA